MQHRQQLENFLFTNDVAGFGLHMCVDAFKVCDRHQVAGGDEL
jgi:hypothetical protein